jgi:hypothetical protein
MVEREELERVLDGLRSSHKPEAIALMSSLQYVEAYMPKCPASQQAMFHVAIGVASHARMIGVTVEEIAAAYKAVAAARKTLAYLTSLPE